MTDCPLCSDILLRHIRSGKTYWLCRRCRLELLEQTCHSHRLGHAVLSQLSVERSLVSYETAIHQTGKVLPAVDIGAKTVI